MWWNLPVWVVAAKLSLVVLLLYFRIARAFGILDIPNHRSSHSHQTIRGAGIVFPLLFLLGVLNETYGGIVTASLWDSRFVVLGIVLVTVLSFWDDVKPLSPGIRLLVQLVSVLLVISNFQVLPLWLLLVCVVGVIGVLNAYNFMDGINGITVLYSLVTVLSVFWLRSVLGLYDAWYDEGLLGMVGAFLAFGFFNLRKRAVCFSGDVGAISVALILCYGLLDTMITSGNWWFILLLGVYGLDSVATIVFRKFRGEQLQEAHRSHLYQYLANERGWSHVGVAFVYAGLQAILSVCLVQGWMGISVLLFGCYAVIYLWFRFTYEGRQRLLQSY